MKINGLVLAAGMSSRMGKFKPLLEMNGRTMIEQSIESMLVSGVDKIVVVLGYRGEDIEAVLDKAIYRSRIQIVYNENYETTEMLDSVKIGVQSIDDCDAFFLLPGDVYKRQPQIRLILRLNLFRDLENFHWLSVQRDAASCA